MHPSLANDPKPSCKNKRKGQVSQGDQGLPNTHHRKAQHDSGSLVDTDIESTDDDEPQAKKQRSSSGRPVLRRTG
jgi:hypothetical protein